MQVYGDARVLVERHEAPTSLERMRERVRRAHPETLERHTAVVQLLIFVGELVQAALDDDAAATDLDDVTPLTEAAHRLLLCAGRDVVASWDALRGAGEGAPAKEPLDDAVLAAFWQVLAQSQVLSPLSVRVPEGYGHYALYPETYLEAARRLLAGTGTGPGGSFVPRNPGEPPLVIGIRSIGASLGAVVAAAVGGGLVTVRPRGEPFRRELRVSSALAAALDPARDRVVLVVDEGPGISGSSFGAVLDWLEDRGARCVLALPSHRGDLGAAASPRHRTRWKTQPRAVVPRDELFPFTGQVPIHGDGWRARLCGDTESWPPSHPHQERPKYLRRTGDRAYVTKLVGLGERDEEKLVRARALGEAGFCPVAHELRHGALVSDWYDHARPRRRGQRWHGSDLARLADYLRFRRCLPVPPRSSASPAELLEMTCANGAETFGATRTEPLGRFRRGSFLAQAAALPRIASDNRLHPWEWIDLPDGRLLKCDAVDHAEGHDLVGPQSLAWDLAGAVEELDLDDAAGSELVDRVMRDQALALSPELLLFHRAAYLAFALGHAGFAESACANNEEAGRWSLERQRYDVALGRLLDRL